MNTILHKIKSYQEPILMGLLFTSGVFFRIYNVWYSEFQGDEIESISFTFFKGNFWQFLMSRSKGPGQYVVNYVILSFAKNDLGVEFYTRVPYLLVGLLVLIILYICIRHFYGFWQGFIAVSFASMSGLLIAFSKISQYQSFVLLFSIVSVCLVTRYLDKGNNRVLLLSGFLSVVSLMFHYDSLSFIIPIIIFLFSSRKLQSLKIYLLPILLVTSVYFTLFFLNPNFKETASYIWSKRINSSSNNSTLQILDILNIYHSREYQLAVLFGLFIFAYQFVKKHSKALGGLFILAVTTLFLKVLLPDFTSFLYLTSLITWALFLISYVNRLYRSKDCRGDIFDFWFLFSFFSYVVVIKFPLTHIYTLFLPMFVAVSISLLELFRQKLALIQACVVLFMISSASFNYSAFIDVKEEYPWQKKEYIFGSMFSGIANKEQVKGVFGFPYKRGWKEISNQLNMEYDSANAASFNSNEKPSIAQYYIDMRGEKFTLNQYDPDVYIFIKRPQSLVNTIKVKGEPFALGKMYSLYKKDTYKIGF